MDSRERMIAMREGVCAAVEDAYFEARQALDTKEARRLFRAAFERGYEKSNIAEPFAFDDATIDRIAEDMEGGIDGFLKQWGWRQFARSLERAHGIHEEV